MKPRSFPMALMLVLLAFAPHAVAQFAQGDVYVGSCGSSIYRYDAKTGNVSVFADSGDGLGCPTGFAFTGPDGLLALSYSTSNVHQFDSAGNGTVVLDSSDGISGPFGENGVARDKLGRIYISNYSANQILRFDPNFTGGTVFADSSDGIALPDGLAFLGNGDLIVANRSGGGNILRIAPNGTTTTFDTVSGEDFYSVAIRNNGDIYAGSSTGNLYRYVSGLPANRVLLTTIGSSNPSISFNSNSTRLYHTSFGDPVLRSVHPETGATTDLATFSEGVVGIAVVPPKGFHAGDIFVGSCGASVYQVDPVTGAVSTFADSADGLSCTSGLEFRRDGGLLVHSYSTGSVFEFDSCGNGEVVLDSSDGVGSPFGENGTIQDGRGRIYIADFSGSRILRFDPDLSNGVVFADASDGIGNPDGLAFARGGNLLVANRGVGNILSITPDGTASTFDSVSGEDFYSIVRRNNGDIYAASTTNRIYRYVGGNASGRTLLTTLGSGNPSLAFSNDSSVLYHISSSEAVLRTVDPVSGAAATLASGFDNPVSIKVAPRPFQPGTIYLGTCGDKVLEVTPGSWTVSGFSPDLSCGSAVALLRDERGMLAASYSDSSVYHYDTAGNATLVLDSSDGIDGPFGENGIVQDFSGNVYVANYGASQILKFDEDLLNMTVFADAADGLVRPDGMAFDASGNMFVANRSSGGQVLKIQRDGSTSVFDTLPEDCFSVAYRRSNGDLYVACGSGNLYRYVGGSAGNRAVLGDYGGGNVSIAFDLPETTLYFASDDSAGSLVVVDPDTGASTVVVSNLGTSVDGIAVAGVQCSDFGSFRSYGTGLAGAGGFVPAIDGSGTPAPGETISLEIRDFVGRATGVMILGFAEGAAPGYGGTVYINFSAPFVFLPIVMGGTPGVPGDGSLNLPLSIREDEIVCGLHTYWQVLCSDAAAAQGVAMTNGLDVQFGN